MMPCTQRSKEGLWILLDQHGSKDGEKKNIVKEEVIVTVSNFFVQ